MLTPDTNKHFTAYTKATGRITGNGSYPNGFPPPIPDEGEAFIDDIYETDIYYIKNKTPTPRPPMHCSLTRTPSGFILRDVPISSTVTLSCSVFTEEYTVSDGTFEYEGRWPDTLKVTISSFPYIDRTEEVRPNES